MVAQDLDVAPSDCCMVATHVWDTIGGQAAGMQSALITRPGSAVLPIDGFCRWRCPPHARPSRWRRSQIFRNSRLRNDELQCKVNYNNLCNHSRIRKFPSGGCYAGRFDFDVSIGFRFERCARVALRRSHGSPMSKRIVRARSNVEERLLPARAGFRRYSDGTIDHGHIPQGKGGVTPTTRQIITILLFFWSSGDDRMQLRLLTVLMLSGALGGCGLSYSRLPEIWDQANDPNATRDMERQVKNAIYCQLKLGKSDIQALPVPERFAYGRKVSTAEDYYMPSSWGVLVQLTLQADEKSALTPGATYKSFLPNSQTFSTGLAGQLSSENIHYHKYNFYYSAKDLAEPMIGSTCDPDFSIGPKTTSSPFVDASNLGIREWLVDAVQVIDFHRSSRAAADGEGAPLAVTGTSSDSSQYDNKFVILTDASVTATWSLVRLSTPTTPLFDTQRTRTHELLMTLAPGSTSFQTVADKRGKIVFRAVRGPSQSAVDAHNAALIGSAVANALRQQ
jgi:hypothetical protein